MKARRAEPEAVGPVRVEDFGGADIFRTDERGEPAERLAKAVWIAQRTLEELELLPFCERGRDEQAHARRRVVKPQPVEVRVDDAEKNVHIRSRRGHRECVRVRAAVCEHERERHAAGDTVHIAEARGELIEEAAHDEKQRLDSLHLALEIEGLRKFLRRPHEQQRALHFSSRTLPQPRGLGAEAVHEFAAWQARELREIVDAPVAEHREQIGRGVEFVQREIR